MSEWTGDIAFVLLVCGHIRPLDIHILKRSTLAVLNYMTMVVIMDCNRIPKLIWKKIFYLAGKFGTLLLELSFVTCSFLSTHMGRPRKWQRTSFWISLRIQTWL